MRCYLDHVIVAVRDLERATSDWRAIGLIATDGGVHPKVGTSNSLVRFRDGSFLELMAVHDRAKLQMEAPALLTLLEGHMDGPFSWALRTDDIEAARDRIVAEGLDPLPIWPGEAKRDSGKIARWRTLHTREPGFPFLVQYEGPPSAEPAAAGLPVMGIGAVVLDGPDDLLERLSRTLGGSTGPGLVRFASGAARIRRRSKDPVVVGVELALEAHGDEMSLPQPSDPRLHGLEITGPSYAPPT